MIENGLYLLLLRARVPARVADPLRNVPPSRLLNAGMNGSVGYVGGMPHKCNSSVFRINTENFLMDLTVCSVRFLVLTPMSGFKDSGLDPTAVVVARAHCRRIA